MSMRSASARSADASLRSVMMRATALPYGEGIRVHHHRKHHSPTRAVRERTGCDFFLAHARMPCP